MNISTADLARRYREMPDEELVAYCRSGTLVPAAQQVAEAEARQRGLDIGRSAEEESDDPLEDVEPGDLVTIATFVTVTEARVLEARLLTEGIGASVVDAHLFQAMRFLAAGRGDVRVQVPEAQVALSRQIMAAIRAGEYDIDDGEAEVAPTAAEPLLADPSGITRADVEAYTQHGYYARVFDTMLANRGRWEGINPSVLLFGSLWFFYRRLPVAALAYLVGVVVVFLLVAWVSGRSGGVSTQTVRDALVVSVVCNRFVAAMLANGLYLRKVLSSIRALPVQGLAVAERQALFRERGGPSVAALGAAVLVPVLLMLVLNA